MTEFEELLTEHKSAVERFVRFKLSSRADADDILQETFLTAFEKFDALRDKERFKPWLLSIARNKCRDYYRKLLNTQEVPIEEMGEDCVPTSRFGLDEQHLVHVTIDSLNEMDRRMINLFFLSGYRQEEISEQLNIPLGTVKSRIHTARKHFKEAYAPENVKKAGAVAMQKMKLPEYIPEYTITECGDAPFPVKWEELMGWFIVPRLGEKLSWGMYDQPAGKCTYQYDMAVTGRVVIHGIEGVELIAKEIPCMGKEETVERTFVAQLTEEYCRYLAAVREEDGVKSYLTFLDGDEFMPVWGFGEDNCGYETNLAPKGKITRSGSVVTSVSEDFLVDIVGRYEVDINGKRFDTVCLMVIESPDSGVLSEQYLDRNGKTVLWRRFNRDDWAVDRYKKAWTELLPESERITVNGATYVHWYDCVTDHVFE